MSDTSTLIRCISPWAELQSAEDIKKGALKESGQTLTNEEEELVALTQITRSPLHQTSLIPDMAQSGTLENSKNAVKASSPSQTPSLSHLHGSSVIDITDDAQATVDQESSEAVSALLASQKDESVALSPYLPLNSSPISSPPIPTSPSPSEGSRRMDVDSVMKPAGVKGGSVKSPKSFNSKIEFATTEGPRPAPSIADNKPLMDKEKTVLSHLQLHHHQQQQLHEQQHTSVHHGVPPPLAEESRKTPQQQIPFNKSTPPDLTKSKVSLSSTPSTVQLDSLKQKPQPPNSSHNQPYPSTNPADLLRAKPHPALLDISKPKTNTSPEVSKHKVLRYSDSSPSPSGCLPIKVDLAEPPRSGFKPVPLRAGVGGVSTSRSTKSPLVYDKNETFTVYRDPALVRSDTENSVTQTNSPNQMTAYLHPHLHTLHSPSPHSTCLTSASHPHGTSHLLAPPHSSPLPHPHLLPPGMLSAMHPPPGTLFGGHPRLDAPGSLSHLALPHPATTHQQQFLQSHGGAAGLGLYPIIWPYPNGTPPPYAPGLNLPSTAKWVHSENPITVNSEASLRRNTASPWLHQAAGSCGEGLGLLNHIPVRPASADAHHPSARISTHTNPSMSKAAMDVHKEDVEKKGFVDPIRNLTLAQIKQDQTDQSRTPTGKDVHLHCLYLDPHSKAHLTNTQEVLHAADRSIKYKEENRQILKESIEVAPFTAKIQRPTDPGLDRDREKSKDPAFPVRIPALASSSPKTSHPHPHVIQSEKSGYFTILSNSVVNEPPRLYPSKEQSSYYDKVSLGAPVVGVSVGTGVQSQGTQSLVSYSSKASLSKPPPLIKHQPEGGEGLSGKITEHLSQQATLIQHQHLTSMDRKDRHSPATSNTFSMSTSLSSVSNHHQQQQHHLRAMPSLYRAPVYHPPIQLSLERKETAERKKEREKGGYGGRLSPPTLTPIQPVSLATAGTATSVEQQKPPTLVPELRDVKLHGVTAAVTSVASAISGNNMNDGLRGREMIQERGSLFCRKKEVFRGKPQAAVASVIVRPATSLKYESPVGANKFGATVHKEVSASYPSKLPGECPRMRETAQEPGGGRVIQPISNLEDISAQYNKTTSMQSSQGPVGLSTTNSLCRSPVVFSSVADVQNKNPKSGCSARDEFGAARTGIGGWLPSLSGTERNSHEGVDSRSMSPGLSLPLSNSAETALQGQSINLMSSPICDSNKTYSPSFVHLKKHKAALAAAQSKTNLPAAPTSMPTGNSSLTLDPVEKSPDCSSTPPPCSSGASSGDISNTSSATGSTAPGKSSLLPNGQTSGSALLAQPSNYHKLKKAWLTRHSEEDKTATTASFSIKAEKLFTTMTSTCNTTAMSDMIKPCTVNLSASTSSEIDLNKDSGIKSERDRNLEGRSAGSTAAGGGGEDRKPVHFSRRGCKRSYDSGSESGGDDSDTSESKIEGRAKRQSKPTYKKKQNDMAKKRGDHEKEEEDVKPNGIFRSAREKTKLKLASSNGIPRSVLKDWRKVKKLKQTGESFLQDDSCSEIGPNLQKCRECRVVRSKKGEEPAHSPVFCRFYYFRRLSYSKNGVIRMDGFSSPDQFDDEAFALWVPGPMEESHLDQTTAKYILSYIGDKFCQMVMTENIAASWIKKDAKLAWKRAVRGVREMCDACEATLFNIHWVCQKCGFVVCLDCYKAKERRSCKDKELYGWLKCVKGQPHDHKHLMPTQIIPGKVLTELVTSMHSLRDKSNIMFQCACSTKQNVLTKLPATNGVSQVLQNVLNHSNKLSLVKAEQGSQQNLEDGGAKAETNGGHGGGSSPGNDSESTPVIPPESQSPLHFLADLAEQKSRDEKKENKQSLLPGKPVKEEKVGEEVLQQCKNTSLVANSTEQGSTLRDLLTTTAGKLKLGSTDAGIAFAPVYSTAAQTGKDGRTMPNILDDIIASVVENKIPPSRQNITTKLSTKQDYMTPSNNSNPAPVGTEDVKAQRKKSGALPAAMPEDSTNQYPDIPHSWLNNIRLLWLKDHRNQNNWKLFRECWEQGQPVLVSGIHKRLNVNLWKADSFNQEFADHQGDLLNCKDQVVSNSGIKEFWDGFEDINKRPKSKDGEPMVYRLKDWPSGEEFMALMPSRYDDLMKNLPLPEYSDPEGSFNLASHLPSFFVRPDLGPRLCCAYGVAASQDQDFGTANLHVEVSDVVSVLVYVGVAKGNGVLSKTGVLKRLEEEDLDEGVRRRLKDSSETPGALWHIYLNRDMDKVQEFLHKLCKEQGLDVCLDQDPIREQGWYLSRKQRQRLLDEHGVQAWTVVQFLGDSVLIPAGAMHQVQNLHSCVQVINDFVSPEHVARSFHLTQELRANKEEVNYEDKLQVKNILYHCMKEVVSSLRRNSSDKDLKQNS